MHPEVDGVHELQSIESIKRYRSGIKTGIADKFRDATEYNAVRAKIFVRFLDCEFLDKFIARLYPRTQESEKIRERIYAKIRFMGYMLLGGNQNLLRAYNSLSEDEFIALGFKRRPSYESLREFIYDKLDEKGSKYLHRLIIEEISQLANEYGFEIGKRIGEDATDIRALKHDPDADYSGYYKEYGYKADFVADLDNDTLILEYTPMKINSNEGKCLIDSVESVRSMNLHPKYLVIDDKYADYKNIGYCGVHNIDMVYKIAKHWKYNSKGDVDEIKRKYQKYHREDDWVVNADLDFMLCYLFQHGEHEYAGAYYRNKMMDIYSRDPDDYLSKCHERSGKIEGMNGYLKTHCGLDSRLPRRGWYAFVRHISNVVLRQAFVALIRLQNGVTEHLTNMTYIT